MLLDNLGDPTGSRAEAYTHLIPPAPQAGQPIASLVGSSPPGGVVAILGGTTQSLPDGRTLVAYGNGNRVEEYDASGNVVWRIMGNPGYVFRATRIRSLYTPGVGGPR